MVPHSSAEVPDPDGLFEEEDSEEEENVVYNYGNAQYWETRYAKDDSAFDWFFGWEKLSASISRFYSATDRALVVGCGNSRMSADMLAEGFPSVASIDLSKVVIAQLRDQYKDEPRLQWYEMNCAKLDFPDESFELVIDKGTIDAIMCGDDSDELIPSTMAEIFRVLSNHGKFVVVSFGSPSERFPDMRGVRRNWIVHPPIVLPPCEEIEDDTCDFIYVFEKNNP
jgi:ubiquinone/menaquinone biosynthesis C-methylase UbiE